MFGHPYNGSPERTALVLNEAISDRVRIDTAASEDGKTTLLVSVNEYDSVPYCADSCPLEYEGAKYFFDHTDFATKRYVFKQIGTPADVQEGTERIEKNTLENFPTGAEGEPLKQVGVVAEVIPPHEIIAAAEYEGLPVAKELTV